MLTTFTASVRDGLSNLAASLGVGRDKASADAFVLRDLDQAQIEAMYRGDWLARKVVDIVPADMCREWRAWSGHRADVERMEAAERRSSSAPARATPRRWPVRLIPPAFATTASSSCTSSTAGSCRLPGSIATR